MDPDLLAFPLRDLRAAHHGPAEDRDRRVLAGRGTRGLGPIVLRVGDDVVTVSPGDEVAVRDGEDARAQVSVEFPSQEVFSDFHDEMRTAAGLHVTGGVRYLSGGFTDLDAWEPALRALYQGRPIFDPADIDRTEASRTFRWGEDDDALSSFLQRFGWAHVRGVFSADEIAEISAEVRRAEDASRPDIGGSWWTRDADGEEVPCQLHFLGLSSAVIGALDHDPRISHLVELSQMELVSHPDRALGTFAVLKRPSAAEGLTNLPWHIDCGLGGHPFTCPGLHIGVQVTASNPELGGFSILPGSHESSVRRGDIDAKSWPIVTVDTEPGDVTLHVPHALHAAPAPQSRHDGRRTLYLGFSPKELLDVIGPGQSFDDLITQTSADGHVAFAVDGTANSGTVG